VTKVKKLEPLIKEKEEVLYVGDSAKKSKYNWLLIRTIIISVIVVLFFFRSIYAFYIGFRYYNLRFEEDNVTDTTQTETTPEETVIPVEPVIPSEEQTPSEEENNFDISEDTENVDATEPTTDIEQTNDTQTEAGL
jgi:flagellar basal body-associated protein FliL